MRGWQAGSGSRLWHGPGCSHATGKISASEQELEGSEGSSQPALQPRSPVRSMAAVGSRNQPGTCSCTRMSVSLTSCLPLPPLGASCTTPREEVGNSGWSGHCRVGSGSMQVGRCACLSQLRLFGRDELDDVFCMETRAAQQPQQEHGRAACMLSHLQHSRTCQRTTFVMVASNLLLAASTAFEPRSCSRRMDASRCSR